MRRLKKRIFLQACGATVLMLGIVRWTFPQVAGQADAEPADSTSVAITEEPQEPVLVPTESIAAVAAPDSFVPHPIRSVYSYAASFPDLQEAQIQGAMRWGVRPVRNREEAEARKNELVYVGASPFFCIDRGMTHSIPYLVPRADRLLNRIGKNYLDSLYIKGIPLHRIIVSSVLRTEDDVTRLRRGNGNASEQSCHRFATTFDICYNRFSTVSPPDGPQRRTVQNDTLKWVLSEVLRDVRQEGLCYIKYEVKQGCFHITVK